MCKLPTRLSVKPDMRFIVQDLFGGLSIMYYDHMAWKKTEPTFANAVNIYFLDKYTLYTPYLGIIIEIEDSMI